MYCNNKLRLNGGDGGIARWMSVIVYIFRFDKVPDNVYLIDLSLTSKVKNWDKIIWNY